MISNIISYGSIAIVAAIFITGSYFLFAVIFDVVRRKFHFSKIALKLIAYEVLCLLILIVSVVILSALKIWQPEDIRKTQTFLQSISRLAPESPVQTPNVQTVNESQKDFTILDYFSMIPNRYLLFELPSNKNERDKWLNIVDEKNLYINMRNNNNWDGDGSLAVFITPQKKKIIAVESKGCGPLCEQVFYLLEYENGLWLDVTEKLLPVPVPKIRQNAEQILKKNRSDDAPINILFRIPRVGTTIQIYDLVSGTVAYSLVWRNGKFDLE